MVASPSVPVVVASPSPVELGSLSPVELGASEPSVVVGAAEPPVDDPPVSVGAAESDPPVEEGAAESDPPVDEGAAEEDDSSPPLLEPPALTSAQISVERARVSRRGLAGVRVYPG